LVLNMAKNDTFGSFFLAELKRRKVVRTCAFYLIACWIFLQVGDILYSARGLDAVRASRTAVYIAVLGFPVTFAIAWFFQISTQGIIRTAPFVERRVLRNISPINDRRQRGLTRYFRKDEAHPEYRWILSAETGPLAGLSFGVTGILILGRSLECDVALVSQQVSRHHARLQLDGDQLLVEDLASANGTVVNGKVVEGACVLQHEDELRFHDIVFRVTRNYSGADSEADALQQTTFVQAADPDANKPNREP